MIPDYDSKIIRIMVLFANALGFILFSWVLPKKIDKEKIKNILIIKLDRIGDTFLATPTIEALRKLFPTAKITFLAAPWNKDVVLENPNINELHVYEAAPDIYKNFMTIFLDKRQVLNLKNEINKYSPDMLIDLQGSPLNVLAGFLVKVRVRVGFKRKFLSFLLNRRVNYSKNIHQSKIYFSIAQNLGYNAELPQFKIFTNNNIEKKIGDTLKNNDLKEFVIFHLGAGRSFRQWPIDKFIELANMILGSRPDIKIIIIGDKSDSPLAASFLAKVKAINLIGILNIREAYSLLRRAKLFIGNLSAPAHFAGSLGIPAVVLINDRGEENKRWRALGEHVNIIGGKTAHKCPGIKCKEIPCPNMAAISVETVWQAAKNFIKI